MSSPIDPAPSPRAGCGGVRGDWYLLGQLRGHQASRSAIDTVNNSGTVAKVLSQL